MIEQYTSPVAVNNSQEPWLVGEGVVVSGGVAIPSLDFNFITGGLPGTVTFTRASTATYFNSVGVLTSAAIDAPRFDFNPATLAAQGLLIEEQRTNSIRNNTMQGAVAGTPGTQPTDWGVSTAAAGLTYQVVGTGTDSGITYIDIRVSGTPSATGDQFIASPATTTGVAALSGQTWTNSMYVKIQAGSLTGVGGVQLRLSERNSVGGNLTDGRVNIIPTTSALSSQRYTQTRTNTNASTAFLFPSLLLNVSSGVAIDITLRIGLPQLELGAFATSVIPTTTTALTRSADVASVNTLSPWFNSTASTLYAEWTPIAAAIPTGATQLVTEIAELTNANFYRIFQSQVAGAKASSNMFSGGANPGRLDSGGAYSNATVKAAAAFAASDRAISANGAVATTSATGALPVGVTALFLGQQAGSTNFLNGYLRRITYYPRKLSSAELQAITA